MLETYFSAPKTLRRLRGGISGSHIDAFADNLERDGYAPSSKSLSRSDSIIVQLSPTMSGITLKTLVVRSDVSHFHDSEGDDRRKNSIQTP